MDLWLLPVPSLPLIGRRTVDRPTVFFLLAVILAAPHANPLLACSLSIIAAAYGWYYSFKDGKDRE